MSLFRRKTKENPLEERTRLFNSLPDEISGELMRIWYNHYRLGMVKYDNNQYESYTFANNILKKYLKIRKIKN